MPTDIRAVGRAEPPLDNGEPTTTMDPLTVGATSRRRSALNDLAQDLVARSATFRAQLPRGARGPLANLVRAMNCYYSNLIEGHNTHPIEIERALRNDYSHDPRKRNLQLEAKSHMEVQQWIDEGGLPSSRAVTIEGLTEIHQRFCAGLPPELLVVSDPGRAMSEQLVPGQLRRAFVKVGRHEPISPGAVPRFLRRFAEGYAQLGRHDLLVAVAAAHHRFLWIHPFLDGNGRVARLMSHALLAALLDTGGLWSVARGLARREGDYKRLLSACDLPRESAYDGRGNLSEEALEDFTLFFLEVCIDQVRFMETLMQPEQLRARVLTWAEEEVRARRLPVQATPILKSVLHLGEIDRGQIASIAGTGERQARRIVSDLIARDVLTSTGARAPLHLAFPAELAQRWMPGLFPPLEPWVPEQR